MSKSLKAVYENGISALWNPLTWTEHQEVTITVFDARSTAANHELICYEIAQRLGIVGMLEHLPSDLSTNRRYFEGFGRYSPKPPGCSKKNRSLFNDFFKALKSNC